MNAASIVLIVLVIFVIIMFIRMLVTVPQRSAYVIERLGKYQGTLEAGFHILIPFADRIAYKLNLKEMALDVPAQICITRDNVAVEVDGILYLQVIDPVKACYGINNYQFASIQLAQTTLRSVMGKLELDKTFEERDIINTSIVEAVDKASEPWGVKVTRYEVKNIVPPQSIKESMEKQMRAEREKRAVIAESEGEMQAKINRAAGDKAEMIARSEGEKLKRINEAEGKASEIEKIAMATASGIREIANALSDRGGMEAVNLRIAEQYISEFGKLAKTNNTMIIPQNMSDVSGVIATAMSVIKGISPEANSPKPQANPVRTTK
jgi:regulator of protease activity HflC (stomatin/prohibitin superfamily)